MFKFLKDKLTKWKEKIKEDKEVEEIAEAPKKEKKKSKVIDKKSAETESKKKEGKSKKETKKEKIKEEPEKVEQAQKQPLETKKDSIKQTQQNTSDLELTEKDEITEPQDEAIRKPKEEKKEKTETLEEPIPKKKSFFSKIKDAFIETPKPEEKIKEDKEGIVSKLEDKSEEKVEQELITPNKGGKQSREEDVGEVMQLSNKNQKIKLHDQIGHKPAEVEQDSIISLKGGWVGTKKPEKEPISEVKEEKKESFFESISKKINTVEITEDDFNEYKDDLEMLLLENNVALEVVDKILENLKENLVGKKILKKEFDTEINDSFEDAIRKILIKPFDILEKIKEKNYEKQPYVILFAGINGSGKTTTIAKIAHYLKSKNKSIVLAAGDTFRSASIEQLQTHGEKLNIPVIAQAYGSDPASVGFDAISYAKKNKIDVVLIDTAGRMYTATNLMKEMEKINRVTKPDLKIFIGESITGNDATEQAKTFNETINIDGIILSKADIDEKGGTALSVGYVTGKPILFLGTGQNYEDIEPFDLEKFVKKLGL